MILLLQQFLRDVYGMKFPQVLGYTSTRIMLAALTALVITIFFGPLFIRMLSAISKGQSIRTEDVESLAKKHQAKKDTPTMGGLLILIAMLCSMFIWMDLRSIFTPILLLTTVMLGGLGFWDDYLKLKKKNTKGVRGKVKLAVQMGVGLMLVLYFLVPGVAEFLHVGNWFSPPVIKSSAADKISLYDYATRLYIPFFKGYVWQMGGVISALFILFVVTGASNAVNLTDGLDGLAAGCLILVGATLALIAFLSNNLELSTYLNIVYIEGSGEVAVYLGALVGACIGFLWYNGYPAQIFMGDTGSLALGGILGVCAVILRREVLLGLVGGIFVIEALSVILQVASYRYRNKKRIFLCAPIHHHFEYMGWPETKVVLRFWIVGLFLAIIGIASLKFQ
jgi:phospho-N-acetylmuramoyl-pentapeptide-transferase